MEFNYSYYFTAKAEQDFDDILHYIAVELNNPTAAKNLASVIFKNIESLIGFPDMGLIVENEFLVDKIIRRILIDNYTLYYKVSEDERKIYIIRIVYGKRNLNEILSSI